MKSKKQELLNDLKKVFKEKLKGSDQTNAINYIEKNSQNFNEGNLNDIFTDQFIPPKKLQINKDIFNKLDRKLREIIQENEEHQSTDQLYCYLVYELIEDQSSEQCLKKIKFFFENYKKIKKDDQDKEFKILGFYGQQNEIIQNIKEWTGLNVNYKQKQNSPFQLFAGKKGDKIIVFLLTDDTLFDRPYEKNSEIVDFIKILQDVCSEVRICLNKNIKINKDSKNPFNQRTQGRVIKNKKDDNNYQLIIKELENRNQTQIKNYDNCFLWNQFLIEVAIENKKKNEIRQIQVKDYIEDSTINFETSQSKNIELDKYPQYLEDNMMNIIQNKKISDVINNLKDNIILFIKDEQEKQQIEKKIQEILDNINQEKLKRISSRNINIKDKYQVEKLKQRNLKESEELKQDAFKKFIEIIKEIDMDINQEKIKQTEIYLTLYSIGFPPDSNNNIDSFQINRSYKPEKFMIKNLEQKKYKVKNILALDTKKGLIIMEQQINGTQEQYYYILQFELKENQIKIQKSNKYPIETDFYIDQQNKKLIILSHEQEQIQINDIKENFQITKDQIIEYVPKNNNKSKQKTNIKKKSIKDFIYIKDKVIFMNEDNELFQGSKPNKDFKIVQLQKNNIKKDDKDNEQNENIKEFKSNFRSKNNKKYQQFIRSVNNNYILLKYDSGIDIYDRNNYQQNSIDIIKNFRDGQVIQHNYNEYLIIKYKNGIKCFSFKGINNSNKRDHKNLDQQEKPLGNSFIDYFYAAIKKYGSNAPYQEKIIQEKILQCDEYIKQQVQKYYESLRNSSKLISLTEINNDKELDLIKQKYFDFLIKTRAPIHIASIEQQQLIPLKNGVNNRIGIQKSLDDFQKINNQSQGEVYFYQQIKIVTDEIQMGIYEDILQNQNFDELKVVCTMGRQSLGKSYLFNRLFGTRFNVDSKRCTDGLWLSMSAEEINNKHVLYVVIDCEGLFNIRRVLEEELQLVLICTGISNLSIFNSENNFGRKLEHFFNQLGKCTQKFLGEDFYQGKLLFLIRDIAYNDKDGCLEEFGQIIEEKLINNDKLNEKTFKGIIYDAMSNFESVDDFNEDIEYIKTGIIKQQVDPNKKKTNLFLENFKLLLAKVFFNDDQDIVLAKIKMNLEDSYTKCLEIFIKGDDCLNNKEVIVKLDNLGQEQIKIYQNEINFKKQKHDNENQFKFEDKKHTFNKEFHDKFRQIFNKKIQYNSLIHNDWVKNYQKFCIEVIKDRIDIVIKYFDDQFNEEQKHRTEIEQKKIQITYELKKALQQFKLCQYQGQDNQQKCRQCYRLCVQIQNHEGVCNCFTDHLCGQLCIDDDCKKQNKRCGKIYGHNDDVHLCTDSEHYCKYICKSVNQCNRQCAQRSKHEKYQKGSIHDCKQIHYCRKDCSLNGCQEKCVKELNDKNHIHQCQDNQCPFECIFCGKSCIFPNHFHQDFIDKKDQKKLNVEINGKNYIIDHHNCGEEHYCQQKCEKEGICECNYLLVKKNKKTKNKKILEYDYTEQRAKRNPCKSKLKLFEKEHQGNHDCEKEEPHRCNVQCPECKIFCEENFGHDGLHKNMIHRNKDNSIYAGINKNVQIEIEKDGEVYKFDIGDNAENERCMSSCINKGRSHVHLMKCPGGNKCYEKQIGNFKARHVEQNIGKNSKDQYDQFLCQYYFEQHNWQPPAFGQQQEIINQCSFACNHYEHKRQNEQVYCQNPAWHDSEHYVGHQHKTVYEKVQIAFLLDCTSSMQPYIDGTKLAIKKILNKFKNKYQSGDNLEFAVVAYRDHFKYKDWDIDYPIKICQFTNEKLCLEFVSKLKEGGGRDPPEALIDGFQGITELQWIEDDEQALKFVFLITDGPPHGEQFIAGGHDYFPNGCICKRDFKILIQLINDFSIRFRFIKIGDQINIFATYLQDKIKEYEEFELDEDIQLQDIVSNSLFEDLKNEYFEIHKE